MILQIEATLEPSLKNFKQKLGALFTVALIKNTECTDCPSDQLKPTPIMEQTIWVRGHLLGRLKGTDSREARRRKGTSFYDVRTEGGGVPTKADIQ